jgi:fatty acid desaturase
MLYKIVPFLAWLHLQNQGQGRVMAPNMKKIIAERAMQRQMLTHIGALLILVLAVIWPALFAYPAGVVLLLSQAWLLWNLLTAVAIYRAHLAKIKATINDNHCV